jgi:threonine aldolase
MRQAGILAAAALHALGHHRARLAEDHANARALAEKLARAPGVRIDLASVETNIVNVEVDAPAEAVAHAARELGVAIHATGPAHLRAVTHLDVSRADVDAAAEILARAVARCGAVAREA